MIPLTSSGLVPITPSKSAQKSSMPITRIIMRKSRAPLLNPLNSQLKPNPQSILILSPIKRSNSKVSITPNNLKNSKILTRKKSSEPSLNHNSSSTLTFADSSSTSFSAPNFFNHFQFASMSRTGIANNKPKEHNQDSLLILKCLNKSPSQHFAAVFDGHGPEGHKISKFLKDQLAKDFPLALKNSFEQIFSESSDQVLKGCIETVKNKVLQSNIDLQYSGSTLIAAYLNDSEFVCANIGDSQAVIVSYDKQWSHRAVNGLHRPANVNEKLRIERAGGRVGKLQDSSGNFYGPLRAWNSKSGLPGLGISRSIGDLYIKDFGVTAEPEVFCLHLKPADKFIILASDGLWDIIATEKVTQVVSKYWEELDLLRAIGDLRELVYSKAQTKRSNLDDMSIILIGRK